MKRPSHTLYEKQSMTSIEIILRHGREVNWYSGVANPNSCRTDDLPRVFYDCAHCIKYYPSRSSDDTFEYVLYDFEVESISNSTVLVSMDNTIEKYSFPNHVLSLAVCCLETPIQGRLIRIFFLTSSRILLYSFSRLFAIFLPRERERFFSPI